MRRISVVLLAAVALISACGGGGGPAPVGLNSDVIRPQFGDSRPHPEAAIAKSRYPVHGIDVARFQPEVDWSSARAHGVNFAFIKATEGGDMVDPMFEEHWKGAARAGVRRGAYHFYYHCRAPEEQARWFFRHVPKRAGDLPPVIDMEWTPTSPTCRIRRPAAVIRADAEVLIRMFTQHYGTAPIVYSTVDFFEDNQMWKLGGADFWLRSVAAHPSDRYPGHHWTFWQYTSTGTIPGITGPVDINAFAGTSAAWADWLAKRAQ